MNLPSRPHRLLAASALCLATLLVACSERPDALLGSARQYLAKNDFKAAIIQIKNALQAQPDSPEARYLLGSALLESGDAVGAETELRRALTLRHPRDQVVPALARALLAQNQAHKLTEEFGKEKLEHATAQADLQLSLSSAWAMLEQNQRAEEALDAALQAAPDYAPAQLEHARRLAMQGDNAGAQKLLDSVLARTPQNQIAWKLKGDIYGLEPAHADDAVAAYRKAVSIKPDFMAAQSALVTKLLQQTQINEATSQLAQLEKLAPNHPHTAYLAALLAFQKRDYAGADKLLQRSLVAAPGNVASLQLAGAVDLQQGQLPAARSHLTQALEGDPKLPLARRLLVVTYLRQQQPASALETLLPGLQQHTPDPALSALAGEVHFRNGDLNRAEEYFKLARSKNPDDGRLRTSLALVEMAQGPASAGLESLRGIAATDTGSSADMALISAAIQQRDYEQALKAIDALEKKQAGQPLAPWLRGRVQMLQGQSAAARSNLQQALERDANYFPAVASLATLDLADNKPQEARKRFEDRLQKDPADLQALLALADLADATGASGAEVARLLGNAVTAHPTNVDARLRLINLYLRNRDSKSARTAAQSAVTAIPDEPRLLDALGRSQRAVGENNQALASYRRLADLNPQSALAWWQQADIQRALKDTGSAIRSLQKAIAIQPDFPDAQRTLVGLYMAEKRQADALSVARTMQKQRPKDDAGYLLEADIHAGNKAWDQALEVLHTGLAQAGSTPLAMRLHRVLLDAGKTAQAGQFSAQWQKDHPRDAAWLFHLGDQALARKDYGAAEQHYAAVLRLQPDNAVTLNNMAWVSGKLKKDNAIGFAEKAVALAPNQAVFLDTLARLQSDKGNHARALELQNKALALQPENALLKLNLARIQLRAGQKELAKKSLDELSQSGSNFSDQAEVLNLRKELARP